MQDTKILLVEDDELASELIYTYLKDCGFDVSAVFTATDSVAQIKNNHYNIALLDINLPDFTGYEVLKSIRKYSSLPVIITSAYSDTKSKLLAFKYGASDYMVKPIDLEELEARIWVQLSKNSEIKMQDDKKVFTIKESCILFKQNILNLTNIEFEILSILIQNANQVVQRDTLISSLSSISSPRSLDNHIKNIRKKIEDDKTPNTYLKTHYGVGYSLRNETISSGV
jgi:DNA-binding response OmpR family regulator